MKGSGSARTGLGEEISLFFRGAGCAYICLTRRRVRLLFEGDNS